MKLPGLKGYDEMLKDLRKAKERRMPKDRPILSSITLGTSKTFGKFKDTGKQMQLIDRQDGTVLTIVDQHPASQHLSFLVQDRGPQSGPSTEIWLTPDQVKDLQKFLKAYLGDHKQSSKGK